MQHSKTKTKSYFNTIRKKGNSARNPLTNHCYRSWPIKKTARYVITSFEAVKEPHSRRQIASVKRERMEINFCIRAYHALLIFVHMRYRCSSDNDASWSSLFGYARTVEWMEKSAINLQITSCYRFCWRNYRADCSIRISSGNLAKFSRVNGPSRYRRWVFLTNGDFFRQIECRARGRGRLLFPTW